MTKQVLLDNGKGQGAYGTAESWTEALANARSHWRGSFYTQKPVRVRLAEFGDPPVVRDLPFVSWAALGRSTWPKNC